jgi:hypothetical protein
MEPGSVSGILSSSPGPKCGQLTEPVDRQLGRQRVTNAFRGVAPISAMILNYCSEKTAQDLGGHTIEDVQVEPLRIDPTADAASLATRCLAGVFETQYTESLMETCPQKSFKGISNLPFLNITLETQPRVTKKR